MNRVLSYCQDCACVTDSINPKKQDGNIIVSQCKKCGRMKENKYSSGFGLVNDIISSKYMPEVHIFDQADDGRVKRANFIGPGTRLNKRLKNYNEKEGIYDEVITKPINKLDEAALEHDLAYGRWNDLDNRNIADRVLFDKAIAIFNDPHSSAIQKINALLVSGIMESKFRLGYGIGGSMINYKPVVMNNGDIAPSLIGLLLVSAPAVGKLLYEKFKK